MWFRYAGLSSSPLTDRIQIIRSPPAGAVGPVLLCSPGLPIIRDSADLRACYLSPARIACIGACFGTCHLGYHEDERLSQRVGCMFLLPLGTQPRQDVARLPWHSTVAGYASPGTIPTHWPPKSHRPRERRRAIVHTVLALSNSDATSRASLRIRLGFP